MGDSGPGVPEAGRDARAPVPEPVAHAIARSVEERSGEMTELLERLVAIDSTNPSYEQAAPAAAGGESRCNELLASWYERAGLQANRVEAAPGRENLVAVRPGSGGGRSLLLNGHIDTVPPAKPDRWSTGPWEPRIANGVLTGLGAADMKGAAAAMWGATMALQDAGVGLAGELQVHSVVGEEAMEHEVGTSACLRAGFTADAAIVTEPSSRAEPLLVAAASPGYMHLRIRVMGKATHHGNRAAAIRPGGPGDAIGVNALEKAIDVVRHLQELERQWGMDKSHPYFEPGAFTIFPGRLCAESAEKAPAPVYFVEEAVIEYGIWYSPGESRDSTIAEIEGYLEAACATDPWLSTHPPQLDWGLHWPPALEPFDGPLASSLAASRSLVLGDPVQPPSPRNPASIAASTDATWIQAAGIPVVVLGPGRIEVAHGPDEHVGLSEVHAAAHILALEAVAWCGQAT